MSPAQPVIAMQGIVKRYYIGKPNELEILHGIDLQVEPGEFIAIVGESGSGKSTMMNILGALDRPAELLDLVGMGERKKHQPNELSGGQKQRVAIARAMANDPSLILADEPTGALDTATSRIVMDLFHKLHEEQHKTIVLITHNPELAEETQRVITLRDGQIVNVRKGAGIHGCA